MVLFKLLAHSRAAPTGFLEVLCTLALLVLLSLELLYLESEEVLVALF